MTEDPDLVERRLRALRMVANRCELMAGEIDIEEYGKRLELDIGEAVDTPDGAVAILDAVLYVAALAIDTGRLGIEVASGRPDVTAQVVIATMRGPLSRAGP